MCVPLINAVPVPTQTTEVKGGGASPGKGLWESSLRDSHDSTCPVALTATELTHIQHTGSCTLRPRCVE